MLTTSGGGAFENRSQRHAFHSESEVRDLGRPLFAPLTPRCGRREKPAAVSAASCRESTASERGDPVLRGFVYKIYKCSCVACSVCHSCVLSCLNTLVSVTLFLSQMLCRVVVVMANFCLDAGQLGQERRA